MDDIVGYLFTAGSTGVSGKKDDDFTARLSTRYSVTLLVCFAVLIGMNGYVRDPLNCWTPAHFHGSHDSYANNYCWVKNTYYVPFGERLPSPGNDDRNHIRYYQWMPIILLLQATFFYIPSMIWHALNQRGGIDADDILSIACQICKATSEDERKRNVKLVVSHMHRFLKSRTGVNLTDGARNAASSSLCSCLGRRMGSYLTLLFLTSKTFYIVNAVGQLFVLSKVLGTDFTSYGYKIATNMVSDHDWTDAKVVAFPRVTFCDIDVRRLGNVQRYTLQCVLPINLYNEKIYIFLWFWLVFVAVASCVSFLVWLARGFNADDRLTFVRNHLSNYDLQDYANTGRSASAAFSEEYLRADGGLLLRLIAHNTNNITTTEVVRALYVKWASVAMPAGRSLMAGEPPVNSSSEVGDDISLLKAGVDA